MSAQNVVASISHSLESRKSKQSMSSEIRFADEERKDKLYEPKHKQKLVRVLTVVAYVIFVSMAAILLSLYYTFLWDPKDVSVRVMRIHKTDCVNVKTPVFHTIPPSTNETQIEKMTTKTTTMNNGLEKTDTTTSAHQKGLLQILTEISEMGKLSLPEFITNSTELKANVTSVNKDYEENTNRK